MNWLIALGAVFGILGVASSYIDIKILERSGKTDSISRYFRPLGAKTVLLALIGILGWKFGVAGWLSGLIAFTAINTYNIGEGLRFLEAQYLADGKDVTKSALLMEVLGKLK